VTPSQGSITFDGHPITSYGNREVDYEVRDSDRVLNSLVISYESVEIVGYDIILGHNWLVRANPDIN
jgi:hypothetical protein